MKATRRILSATVIFFAVITASTAVSCRLLAAQTPAAVGQEHLATGPSTTTISGGVSDPDAVLPPESLNMPAYNTPVTDPVFATTMRRLTDSIDNDTFSTHIYSQLQTFSPGNEYILLIEDGDYVVKRLSDLSAANLDTAAWNAPRWQPALPATVLHYDSNEDTTLRVQYSSAATGQTSTVFTFPPPYERIRGNQSFDELSRDGRWLAGMASQSGGEEMIFSLDLQTGGLGAQLGLSDLYAGPCEPDPDWGIIEPDWIGVSPLGNYLVIQWPRDGTERCSGLETFDIASGAFTGRVYDGHQHGDLGVLPDGTTEFFMTFELYHPSGNLSLGYRLLPGSETVSEPTYVQVMEWHGAHISCQGPDGVCLVTTDVDESNGWNALEGELFLQYTDGSVLRLAHHRSSSCGYWVQPRASLSADGRYVAFASDWGQETGQESCDGTFELGAGDAFLIDLENGTPPPALDHSSYLPAVVRAGQP